MARYHTHPLAVIAVAGAFLGLAGTAHASLYLSRAQATQAANTVARRNAAGTVRTSGATCLPTDRPATARNLRRLWRLWDCGWSVQFTQRDASVAACTGKLRLTGRTRGSTYRNLQARSCTTLTPAPSVIQGPPPKPTPSVGGGPAPTPSPSPTPSSPLPPTPQSQMIEYAVKYGIGRANELIRAGGQNFFYYGQMHRDECQFLNATKVRCPLYVWFEQHNTDSNFYDRTTREIFQTFIFVEDLGTSVGFNPSMEPQSVLSFEHNRPYYMLCSDYYSGLATCPANRFPIAYPPVGPSFRLS